MSYKDEAALAGETIASGAPAVCRDCKTAATGNQVLMDQRGHYIGTRCKCGPYSRESFYYSSRGSAQDELDRDKWARR